MGDGLEEVNLGADFKAAGVSCGLEHTCAWTVGGRMKCWGGNAYGQVRRGIRGEGVDRLLEKKGDVGEDCLCFGRGGVWSST